MRRREFVTLLACSLAWSEARGATKVWRVGFLSGRSRPSSFVASDVVYGAFLQGMRDLGYVEGTDFIMEWRFAGGDYGRLPELAAELVSLNVDIIVTNFTGASRAAQQATGKIPIVFGYASDPVATGLIQSLAKPGGNLTGLAKCPNILSF
jgi:putative tryptophan/tyrosine transport system substrate-binding protein